MTTRTQSSFFAFSSSHKLEPLSQRTLSNTLFGIFSSQSSGKKHLESARQ